MEEIEIGFNWEEWDSIIDALQFSLEKWYNTEEAKADPLYPTKLIHKIEDELDDYMNLQDDIPMEWE